MTSALTVNAGRVVAGLARVQAFVANSPSLATPCLTRPIVSGIGRLYRLFALTKIFESVKPFRLTKAFALHKLSWP